MISKMSEPLRSRARRFWPLLSVCYLSIMGGLSTYAAMRYMHIPLSLAPVAAFAGIVFSIYVLNRFSDMTEDFANDAHRAIFFSQKRHYFHFVVGLLSATVVALALTGKLSVYLIVLVLVGVAYSYNLLPWYRRGSGWVFVRLKGIPFVKNISVAVLWGTAVFAVPLVFYTPASVDWLAVGLLIVTMSLTTLNSTLFGDIMDMDGDRLADNTTLPLVIGEASSYRILTVANAAWALAVVAFFISGAINLLHCLFMVGLCLYPFTYLWSFRHRLLERWKVQILSESDLLLFGLGMLALSAV